MLFFIWAFPHNETEYIFYEFKLKYCWSTEYISIFISSLELSPQEITLIVRKQAR